MVNRPIDDFMSSDVGYRNRGIRAAEEMPEFRLGVHTKEVAQLLYQ